jgi:hypothetical protein
MFVFGADRKSNKAARAHNVFWLVEILKIFFQLQITSDYMKKCNWLQLITITNYDYPMSGPMLKLSRVMVAILNYRSANNSQI